MAKLSDRDLGIIKTFVSHPRGHGYVLDFSDTSFSNWFRDNWAIDIDDPAFQKRGGSKGNRLVAFAEIADKEILIDVLKALKELASELGIVGSSVVTARDLGEFDRLLVRLIDSLPEDNEAANSEAPKKKQTWERAKLNSVSLSLSTSALIENLIEYREIVRSDNYLASENAELRDKLLKLVDAIIGHLEVLLEISPSEDSEVSDLVVERLSSWTERFVKGAVPKLSEYVDPENLGRSSVPVGVILGCGGIGALLTGFSPIGFGAGTMAGKFIVGEMKSGVAADNLAKSFVENE